MNTLHRRLAALLGLIALGAFVSGAGLDAPAVVPAAVVLLVALLAQPGERTARILEPIWRTLALLLAVRAVLRVADGSGDLVLPMVDLLLLLLCSESVRHRDGSGDARHFALTFALLIAAAAYRPGPLFGVLFVAYVVCATVVLVVGHLGREARAHGMDAPAPRRPFLLRVALLSTVVLLVSGSVFLFFPRVSRGFAARATPVAGGASIGFSDRVSIGDHGARLEPNPEPVLRVEFPRGVPRNVTSLHWRGRSYDVFDGIAWARSGRPAPVTRRNALRGDTIVQVIYARPLGSANVIFGLHPLVSVTAESRIRPFAAGSGDYLYLGQVDPVYRVTSRAALPPPAELRAAADGTAEGMEDVLASRHLQLPPLSPRILQLADSFRVAHANTWDRASAIEQWLRTQFNYSLDLPATAGEATLDHFLFVRRAGHCEYFSTAMAVLLRASGVPSRNVNGFLGGDWNEFGQFLTVTQNNAHSWVEVWFAGVGWVPFDPTPGGGAAGVAATDRLAGLRNVFAGLEHRWGKWVLDFDLESQASILERAAAPFRRDDTSSEGVPGARYWPWAAAVLLAGAAAVAMRRVRFGGRSAELPETRAYLRLRRAYERAGFPAASRQAPLAWSDSIAHAPGADDARRAVDIYLRSRWGRERLDDGERETMLASIDAARRALRSQGRNTPRAQ